MNIHILGIAGTMTAPLAIELKTQGHTVTGSDQDKIYPPISTLLDKAKIPINQTDISTKIDLVIVGSSFRSFQLTRQQYQQSKSLGLNITSATKYIAENVGRKNTILIAGTHGKTTITSLLVWIFTQAKINPCYMFGGTSLNRLPSLKITPSDWSIIEADESINGLDKKAKFLYYPVTHLILTSAQWEHRECYPTASSNLNAFRRLVKRIPKNGFFVYQPKDPNNLQLLSSCRGKAIPYHAAQRFNTSLLGQYNQENISSAYTLCQNLGLDHQLILSAIKSYRGISRRVQLLKKTSGIYFFDDFAQSPERIKTVLSALRDSYPDKSIKVFLEAHASFLKTKTTIVNLSQAFQEAREVVLYRINFSTKISTDKRATFQDFRQSIGDKLVYLPIAKDIYNHYIKTLGSNDIVVHFSSGGLDGIQLFRQIIKHF